MFDVNSIVKHIKTNATYVILGTPLKFRLEKTEEPAYAYRSTNNSSAIIWLRSQTEMEDGRFILMKEAK